MISTIVTIIATLVFGVLGWVLKWSIERTLKSFEDARAAQDLALQRERTDLLARIAGTVAKQGELEGEIKKITEKLHAVDLMSVRQDGEIRLLREQHVGITSDLKEIEGKMVTRDEFRTFARQLESSISQILARMDGPGRGYAPPQMQRSVTPGPMTRVESPPPPRERR